MSYPGALGCSQHARRRSVVYAICAARDSFPAAGRLKSTMVWCQVYGAPPRRRSVWAVAGERQPTAAWTRPGCGL